MEFCNVNELKKSDVVNYTTMRKRADGNRGYPSRATFELVKQLREIIHPDYWYIFPCELEKPKKIKITDLFKKE